MDRVYNLASLKKINDRSANKLTISKLITYNDKMSVNNMIS